MGISQITLFYKLHLPQAIVLISETFEMVWNMLENGYTMFLLIVIWGVNCLRTDIYQVAYWLWGLNCWKTNIYRVFLFTGILDHLCAHMYRHNLGQENLLRMVRWMRWHCPPDTRWKFVAWRSEAEHGTSWSQRLLIILCRYKWAEKKHFGFLKARVGFEPAISDFPSRH